VVSSAFLKSIPLFFGFTNQECQIVLRAAQEKCFPKDKIIFREGQRGDALYIIISGSVIIEKQPLLKSTGALSTLHFKTGDFFGELALFDTGPRTSNARTLEKTTVIVLMQQDFLHLLKKSSLALKFLKNCIQVIASRIRHVNRELMVFYELDRFLSHSYTLESLCVDVLTVLALSLDVRRGRLFLKNEITGDFEEKARYEYKKAATYETDVIDWDLVQRVLEKGMPWQEFRKEAVLLVPFGLGEVKKGLVLFSGRRKRTKSKSVFTPDEINMVSTVVRLFETALLNIDYRLNEQSRQRLKRKYIAF
jgi:CRP-like cAMP-binding protein